MNERVPGCHGIAVSPKSLGLELGWLQEPPPVEVSVELCETVDRAPEAELVWQLEEPPRLGFPAITTQTWLEPSNRVWVGNTFNLSLRVDHPRRTINIAARSGNQQVILEALGSVALPLFFQRNGGLVLHAAAVAAEGSATLLCADGGSGKSSLLMGLVAAGWEALTEDQCVVDLDAEGRHRVWPGPSWVRLKRGAWLPPLVAEEPPRFETVDKVAWDLARHAAHSPARVDRLVLLEPPGGNKPVWEALPEEQVIGTLVRHAGPGSRTTERFAATVLPTLVNLGMSVPGFRMRLPRRPDWLKPGVALLESP